MYYSRCLKKDITFLNNRLNNDENNKNIKKDFTINSSILITYANDFKNKKREMSSFCENNINNNIYTNEKKTNNINDNTVFSINTSSKQLILDQE